MRLRKLTLHGFKSFADRTEFVFDAPITGIVGPNGCGKSNVVDAFKWVLGEQSAKSLRGDAMMDVIFNGAAGRKPGGMAEVVLTFDNPLKDDGAGGTKRVLPIDTDEVSVGRRLFRDGTSEYTLNNKTSRLKDIRELFLDTGIGVDAYSVIEQGRVAQLLDANPQERRQIFEEAAGISKFKQRKKEAQRKLEKVDQNLLRVSDIVDEVERRLRGVRVQAGRARVYQEHMARLSSLRLEYALREYHGFVTEHAQVSTVVADVRFRLDDSATELSRAEAAFTEQTEAAQAVAAARQRAEYALIEAGNRLEQTRQAQAFARRQLAEIEQQTLAQQEALGQSQSHLAEAREHLAAERERLAGLTAEVDARSAEISGLQEAFRAGQLRLNELAREQEQHKSAVLDAMRRHAQVSNRLSGIEAERRNLGGLQQRQSERRRLVTEEIAEKESRRAEVEALLAEAVSEIETRKSEVEAARAESRQLGQHLASLTEKLSSAKEHRSALLGRQRVLQDLERRQQGVSEGVKAVLARRESEFGFVRGLVADVLRVDIEHARVIEAALDGRDQWVVVTSLADALNGAVAFSKLEGRVNFVSAEPLEFSAFDRRCVVDSALSAGGSSVAASWAGVLEGHATDVLTGDVGVAATASPEENNAPATFYIRHPSSDINHYAEELANSPVPVRIALDLVRFEPEFGPVARRLLSRVAVVEDLLAAEHLRQHGPTGWRYITLAGEVLDTDGTFHAGPPAAVTGLLTRRSELEQLSAQVAESEAEIAELTAALQGASEQAKAVEGRLSELRNRLYEANTRQVEASSLLSQLRDRLSVLQREQPLLDRELAQLMEQQGRLTAEEQTLRQRLGEIEAQQASATEQAESAGRRHGELAETLRAEGERLAAARVAIAEYQQKQIAARHAEARLSGEVTQAEQEIQRLAEVASQLAERSVRVREELEEGVRREEGLIRQQGTLREEVETLTSRAAELTAAVKAAGEAVSRARASHQQLEQELNRLLMKESELKVRLEGVVNRTRDELSIELPEHYAGQVAAAEGSYVPEDKDWDGVAREIAELREKIQRLGNVNLDAIGEQDELEQRSTFLAKELTDLRDAKQQLEALIDEINRESSVRFMSTFELVREHFQGMFRKLFGGGKADLYLETELEPKQQTVTITHPDGTTTTEAAPMIQVDPLDAGIEVIARPPGKQPVSISQLSGGEKTMTCVALLLSIFKSKPSPFCILDEVDAALDEANNQRFNLIVQEFLDRSQFIIITHSKRTMTIADQLYGVTQQEQGVSRRVSVRFDQVSSDGRIDPRAVREQPPEADVAGKIGPSGAVAMEAVGS